MATLPYFTSVFAISTILHYHTVDSCSSRILSPTVSERRSSADTHTLDLSAGVGRRFDGVGAISGGGATSKLLVNYPEPQRTEILDYLFRPNFGAALHILKVEIGGDSQSSEGTESSHMHDADDESYHRGYEWWLMKEAKKRNPAIKLYGLPWGFPGWLADGEWWPYRYPNRTADYIVRWVQGAKRVHGLQIDYLGIWNEKPYDITYVKTLRNALDAAGFAEVQIVAADLIGFDSWDIIEDLKKDTEFDAAVGVVGGHYTGTWTTQAAKDSGKVLWSSEDYSTGDSEGGGGCMARIVNQNYVNGLMTSTIAWNLIYSYYAALPYSPVGLMTAQEPWSGHYVVSSPIWTTAHMTQFTQPGWSYLSHGHGVGLLAKGGSIVSLVSPDRRNLTVVIETMNMENGDFCWRLPQQKYKVRPQNITLLLRGPELSSIVGLHLWRTTLGLGHKSSEYFHYEGFRPITAGRLTIFADINSVFTLTTLTTGRHGQTPDPVPASKPFPHPYADNFDNYPLESEPYNFAQQVGVFEIRDSTDRDHGRVECQVVSRPPIFWCPLRQTVPLNVIGDYGWSDVDTALDVYVPSSDSSMRNTNSRRGSRRSNSSIRRSSNSSRRSDNGHVRSTNSSSSSSLSSGSSATGVFIAARVDQGGCTTFFARGLFFFLHFTEQTAELTHDLAQTETIAATTVSLRYDHWHKVALKVKGRDVVCLLDGVEVITVTLKEVKVANGFTAHGTENFGVACFDNFFVDVL